MRCELLQRLERSLESFCVVSQVNLNSDAIVACHLLQGRVDILYESVLHDFIVSFPHDLVGSLLQKTDVWGKRGMFEGDVK